MVELSELVEEVVEPSKLVEEVVELSKLVAEVVELSKLVAEVIELSKLVAEEILETLELELVLVELRDGKTVPELVYDSEEAELVYDGINSLVELSEDEELEGLVLLKGGI